MATVSTLAVNLFANTQQFQRGMKDAERTLKRFVQLGRGTIGAGAIYAIGRIAEGVTAATRAYKESEKSALDFTNVLVESLPVIGGTSRSIRELATELSGLAETQRRAAATNDFLKDITRIEKDLDRKLEYAKAGDDEKKRLTVLYEYQDLLSKIAEKEKYIAKVKEQNAEIQRKINILINEQSINYADAWSGISRDITKEIDTLRGDLQVVPAGLDRLKNKAQELYNVQIKALAVTPALLQESVFWLNSYTDGLQQLKDIYAEIEQMNTLKEQADALKDFADSVKEFVKTPAEKFAEYQEKLYNAFMKGVISFSEMLKASDLMRKQLLDKTTFSNTESATKLQSPELGGSTASINPRFMSVRGMAMGDTNSLLAEMKEQTTVQKKIRDNTAKQQPQLN